MLNIIYNAWVSVTWTNDLLYTGLTCVWCWLRWWNTDLSCLYRFGHVLWSSQAFFLCDCSIHMIIICLCWFRGCLGGRCWMMVRMVFPVFDFCICGFICTNLFKLLTYTLDCCIWIVTFSSRLSLLVFVWRLLWYCCAFGYCIWAWVNCCL